MSFLAADVALSPIESAVNKATGLGLDSRHPPGVADGVVEAGRLAAAVSVYYLRRRALGALTGAGPGDSGTPEQPAAGAEGAAEEV